MVAQPDDARHGDGLGALRHRARLARRRLADRPVRRQAQPLSGSASCISFRPSGRASPRASIPFIVARFIGGLGVGMSTVAAPLYIAEIAPPAWRGRLAGMFQFNIVFGILVAFVSNALLAGIGEHAWRWMLGVEAVPALIYTVLCFAIPESPRWLIARKGDRAAGVAGAAPDQPEASTAEIEATANVIRASASDRRGGGEVLDAPAARADPARLPRRVLQPALGHQRRSCISRRASSR